jgi:pyruvate dehydrogenase E2 component (dihydrolipoamide acetyltransferase)
MPQRDAPNQDLERHVCKGAKAGAKCPLAELKAACAAREDCAGFNTDGFLKRSTAPTEGSLVDLYVKTKARGAAPGAGAAARSVTKKGAAPKPPAPAAAPVAPPAAPPAPAAAATPKLRPAAGKSVWLKVPGADAQHQDLTAIDCSATGACTVEALKRVCARRADCAGFNTDGFLKSTITKTSKAKCDLYIKPGVPAPPVPDAMAEPAEPAPEAAPEAPAVPAPAAAPAAAPVAAPAASDTSPAALKAFFAEHKDLFKLMRTKGAINLRGAFVHAATLTAEEEAAIDPELVVAMAELGLIA